MLTGKKETHMKPAAPVSRMTRSQVGFDMICQTLLAQKTMARCVVHKGRAVRVRDFLLLPLGAR